VFFLTSTKSCAFPENDRTDIEKTKNINCFIIIGIAILSLLNCTRVAKLYRMT